MAAASSRAVTAELHRLQGLRGVRPQQPPQRPTPWVAHAACRGHDPEQWMDDAPGRPTAAARAVCAACPVRAACLAHALAHDEPWGMWGGLTTRERVAHRLGLPLHDPARPYMGTRGPRKTKPSPARQAS